MEMQQEKPKYMYEKLKEDYERSKRDKNKGHMVGFYKERPEFVAKSYDFDMGRYSLRSSQVNEKAGINQEKLFFWWNYNSIE